MALGVLNNLNAVYAENSLNNTSNSLSKTLQQLSSGSKINSGSDDAAGLSLVDGLAANNQALTQSETNASEGVGLLTVADGALSQVTSLLNRAVTLATEAGNGTLNSSQLTAANQEYQSILSEINNIGTTTTYNDKQVFGTTTNIYTGDSSTTGAAQNSLNIRSLSSANIGDTGGEMAYSNASSTQTDTFLDSTAVGTGATVYDAAASSLTFAYQNSAGQVTTQAVSIAAGATLSQVATDINNAGLGLTATVTNAQNAGDARDIALGNGDDEGIMITGSFGTTTNAALSGVTAPDATAAASAVGSVSSAGTFSGGTTAKIADSLSGTITLQSGTNASTTINMSAVNAAEGGTNYTDLANYINANTQLGVTATVSANANLGHGTIAFQSANSLTSLNISDNLTDTTAEVSTSYTATAPTAVVLAQTSMVTGYTADAGTASTSNAIATISYSDAAGQNLATTDLSTQSDAETTLTSLNAAISDVAAQDGYIGAQINTLNSVSSVLSTQSENVQAAQNDVQATDYAAAASDMSKYQILSQTGISALAQANSTQQEVTKLLQ